MRLFAIVLFLMTMLPRLSFAQTPILLYDGAIPNSIPGPDHETSDYGDDSILRIARVSRPTLTAYLPPKGKANGTAVIICPGGGYSILAAKHEGSDVARRLVESGVTAFVLKYRIPDDSTMPDKSIGPLQDAQRAIQVVRTRAAEWGIKPARIGIMGFSAGGHLASSAGTHFEKAHIDNPANISLRPDFMILVYPVISFTEGIGHRGSADNLIGKNPSAEKITYWSNEKKVNDSTPPAFLVHAKDDTVVPFANSLVFAEALKVHHVSREVYLYARGGHGFGLVNSTSKVVWMDLCLTWMKQQHLL